MGNWLLKSCFATVCIALTSAVGCSRSPYELAPVRGTVTIDSRPLSQAKVMFAPIESGDNPNPGKPAFGLLQPDGSFVLTTYSENDGAVIGEHWVTIINLAKKPAGATLVSNTSRGTFRFSRLTVPQKVSVIAGQDNQIDLKLTAEDVNRYGVQLDD
jgi:hypothetical protein